MGVGLSEYKQVVSASIVTFSLLAMSFMVLEIDSARHYFVVAFPLGGAGLVLSRLLWRKWLIRQRRFGHFLSQVVVAGKRHDVDYVLGAIEKNSGAAYTVVGTVLDEQPPVRGATNCPIIPTYYGLENVAGVTSALGADAVIVASYPNAEGNFIHSLAWQLEGAATELILASRLADVAGPRIHFRPVDGLPLIHVEIPAFEGGKHVLKRVLDVIVSRPVSPSCSRSARLSPSSSHGTALVPCSSGRNGSDAMDIREFLPACPPAVASFFQTALSPNRTDRPQTAHALRKGLFALRAACQ